MNGVSDQVIMQLALFGESCLLGAYMAAIYDVIRIFRRIIRHGIVWISVEDIGYWLVFAIVEFVLLYNENNGVPRGYVFGGTAAGVILYHFLISRYLMKAASKIIRIIKKQLKKACKAVTIWLSRERN